MVTVHISPPLCFDTDAESLENLCVKKTYNRFQISHRFFLERKGNRVDKIPEGTTIILGIQTKN